MLLKNSNFKSKCLIDCIDKINEESNILFSQFDNNGKNIEKYC